MKRFVLLGSLLLCSGCISGTTEDRPSLEEQDQYLQALLDANGLSDVKAIEVAKVLNPDDPRQSQEWFIDLKNRSLQSFTFTADVARLLDYYAIDLSNNQISTAPQNMGHKKWRWILLNGNNLCNLSKSDSASLDNSNAVWKDRQDCE